MSIYTLIDGTSPEPPKGRRRKAAVWATAKAGFSRPSMFVSPEPIAFRRWTFSGL